MIEIDENVSLYMYASGRHTPELGFLVMWLFFVLFAGDFTFANDKSKKRRRNRTITKKNKKNFGRLLWLNMH